MSVTHALLVVIIILLLCIPQVQEGLKTMLVEAVQILVLLTVVGGIGIGGLVLWSRHQAGLERKAAAARAEAERKTALTPEELYWTRHAMYCTPNGDHGTDKCDPEVIRKSAK